MLVFQNIPIQTADALHAPHTPCDYDNYCMYMHMQKLSTITHTIVYNLIGKY